MPQLGLGAAQYIFREKAEVLPDVAFASRTSPGPHPLLPLTYRLLADPAHSILPAALHPALVHLAALAVNTHSPITARPPCVSETQQTITSALLCEALPGILSVTPTHSPSSATRRLMPCTLHGVVLTVSSVDLGL